MFFAKRDRLLALLHGHRVRRALAARRLRGLVTQIRDGLRVLAEMRGAAGGERSGEWEQSFAASVASQMRRQQAELSALL
ncbi:hypothetical protein, partial [Brevundimonas sp.]|uniref:hypothetical protein n=1 Tax=Brevundimonas sp. TaxID=1871086 RepID=UPI00391C5D05